MPTNHKKYLIAAAVLMTATLSCSACGYTEQKKTTKTYSSTPAGSQAVSYYEKSYVTDRNGKFWVPLKPAITSLGYRIKDDSSKGGYATIGYSDVMFKLRPGSSQVFSLGQKLDLPDQPQRWDGQIFVTTTALSKLLQTEVGWNPTTGQINIAPPSESETANQPEQSSQSRPIRIQSLSADESKELISYAKKFLGTPYEFGADAYENSKTFDCSSFTRHVFKKFGVNLPRLAKDQDNNGTRVQRSELQTGDLIFFTVPGRFESDAIPGHVGIYIGDGKFIHTWGDPGVQISNLDSGYWNNVILHMVRVL